MPDATPSEGGPVLLRTLHRGQVVTGTVTKIASFGVTFVDIGGLTAMINIPELSWRRIVARRRIELALAVAGND